MSAVTGADTSTGNGVAAAISAGSATEAWPTPHAEIEALNNAKQNYTSENISGATCYVTLEPCVHHGRTSPCTESLINAGIRKVIAASIDPNPLVAGKGLQQLKEAGIETASGLMEVQAAELNPGFTMRMQQERPLVRCKLAMSLDGKTAVSNGDSKWISSAESRMDVQKLRARSSAISGRMLPAAITSSPCGTSSPRTRR